MGAIGERYELYIFQFLFHSFAFSLSPSHDFHPSFPLRTVTATSLDIRSATSVQTWCSFASSVLCVRSAFLFNQFINFTYNSFSLCYYFKVFPVNRNRNPVCVCSGEKRMRNDYLTQKGGGWLTVRWTDKKLMQTDLRWNIWEMKVVASMFGSAETASDKENGSFGASSPNTRPSTKLVRFFAFRFVCNEHHWLRSSALGRWLQSEGGDFKNGNRIAGHAIVCVRRC